MATNPIERYLRKKKLTQRQLAKLTGVPDGQLSMYRRDLQHPTINTAFALEKATKGGIPAIAWAGRVLRKED